MVSALVFVALISNFPILFAAVHNKSSALSTSLDIQNFLKPFTVNLRAASVVRVLASGTQVRGFKPSRSHQIFWVKKSSACLPSEGK
jgi:hypothetical protein